MDIVVDMDMVQYDIDMDDVSGCGGEYGGEYDMVDEDVKDTVEESLVVGIDMDMIWIWI